MQETVPWERKRAEPVDQNGALGDEGMEQQGGEEAPSLEHCPWWTQDHQGSSQYFSWNSQTIDFD